MSGGYLWFITRMTEILAWPATILLSVWLLRSQFFQLLQNLRSLKYKDIEIVFGEGLDRAQEELHQNTNQEELDQRAANAAQEADDSKIQKSSAALFLKWGGFERLLQASTNAAIIEAWSYIEKALVELAQKHQYEGRRNVMQMIEHLQRKEVLPSGLTNALQELRRLRNIAAHPPQDVQISRTEALRYKVITSDAHQVLSSLIAKR